MASQNDFQAYFSQLFDLFLQWTAVFRCENSMPWNPVALGQESTLR